MSMFDAVGTAARTEALTNSENPERVAIRDEKYINVDRAEQAKADAMAAAPQAEEIHYDNYHAQRMLERLGE